MHLNIRSLFIRYVSFSNTFDVCLFAYIRNIFTFLLNEYFELLVIIIIIREITCLKTLYSLTYKNKHQTVACRKHVASIIDNIRIEY